MKTTPGYTKGFSCVLLCVCLRLSLRICSCFAVNVALFIAYKSKVSCAMVVLSFHIRLVCVCLCLCVDAFSQNDRCPVEDLCVVPPEERNYCVYMSVLSLRLCCCALNTQSFIDIQV